MNNKVILAIIAVLIVLGGVLVLVNAKNSSKQASDVPTSAGQPSQQSNQNATTITVTKDGFSPKTATVKAGTRVTWVNQSGTTVTVNSNPHPTHQDYLPLNLGEFDNGSSVQLVFDKAGKYGYHNHFNPSQMGVVIVE